MATMRGWVVARQIAFYAPADNRGKRHAAWSISHAPVCGTSGALGSTDVIRTAQGDASYRVHPLVCRTCLRLSTRPGVSATGIER